MIYGGYESLSVLKNAATEHESYRKINAGATARILLNDYRFNFLEVEADNYTDAREKFKEYTIKNTETTLNKVFETLKEMVNENINSPDDIISISIEPQGKYYFIVRVVTYDNISTFVPIQIASDNIYRRIEPELMLYEYASCSADIFPTSDEFAIYISDQFKKYLEANCQEKEIILKSNYICGFSDSRRWRAGAGIVRIKPDKDKYTTVVGGFKYEIKPNCNLYIKRNDNSEEILYDYRINNMDNVIELYDSNRYFLIAEIPAETFSKDLNLTYKAIMGIQTELEIDENNLNNIEFSNIVGLGLTNRGWFSSASIRLYCLNPESGKLYSIRFEDKKSWVDVILLGKIITHVTNSKEFARFSEIIDDCSTILYIRKKNIIDSTNIRKDKKLLFFRDTNDNVLFSANVSNEILNMIKGLIGRSEYETLMLLNLLEE